MAAAAAWRAARQKTAAALLTTAPTERFEAFVRNWAESDDEPYSARGQTLRARGDYPGLSERPAWPRPAWADELEEKADVIADEYVAAAHNFTPYFGGDYGDDYAGLDIAKQGEVVPGARERFPETIKALEHVAGDDPVGATRLAFFARQGPQSHVPPHSDMVNFLLTCHLGIVVPEDCRLFFTTSRETPPVEWARGILSPPLQTSFEHAAFNDSEGERVVLFFDVFHPELSREERGALADFERRRRADEEAFWGGRDDRAPPGGDDAASLFAEAARLRREAERDAARPPVAAPRRRGFSTDVSRPRQAFGTSASQAAQKDVNDLLRTRLALSKAELERVARHLLVGARETVEPKLDWLQTRLELDAAQLKRMVVTHPSLLTLGVEATRAPTVDWLQRRLGLDAAQLRKMVLRLPPLLGYSVEGNMAPKLDWLQDRLKLDAAQLKKVVVPFPALLGYRVEDNLAPKLDWLQTRLDLYDAQLRKMILTSQALLGYSVDDNMKPTLGWLRTRLDLSDAALKKMVLALPPLLGLSVVDNVAPTLAWLQKRMHLGDAGLRKVVVAYPTLLGLRVERMEANCAWLESRLGLDEAQLARVVAASPPLLYLSVDGNLAPKLDYLVRATGLSVDELRAHVLRLPAIPSYSLERRYRPRVEACVAAGVDPAYVLTSAPYTDEKFDERLALKRDVVVM